VPHFVALSKVMENSLVQKTMGVGKQPDPHDSSYRRAAAYGRLASGEDNDIK
jgi:hypothetical protein